MSTLLLSPVLLELPYPHRNHTKTISLVINPNPRKPNQGIRKGYKTTGE
jgi:hypothetical protein